MSARGAEGGRTVACILMRHSLDRHGVKALGPNRPTMALEQGFVRGRIRFSRADAQLRTAKEVLSDLITRSL